MKNTLIIIFLSLCTLSFGQDSTNTTKKVETISFKVNGTCGHCKERIENAATIKGVKLANWDSETKMMEVIFKPKLVSKEDIQKSVSAAGHDTGNQVASKDTYEALPGCCQYRDPNVKCE
jgi:copper chaperone CopZ